MKIRYTFTCRGKKIFAGMLATGQDDINRLIYDLRYAANLIDPNLTHRFENMLSQGAVIWPDKDDKGPLTVEQFVRGREKYLNAFMKGLELPDMTPESRMAGQLMLMATVLRELLERAQGKTIGVIDHPDPDQYISIGPGGKATPAKEAKGPHVTFFGVNTIDLPPDERFILLPEHMAVLRAAQDVLQALRPMLEEAIKPFADERPEDLEETTQHRLGAALRLIQKIKTGTLRLPGSSGPELPLH